MTPERWQAVKRLFNDALEREPRERAAYVAEAAKTDPALAEEVRALLAGQGRADEAFNPLTRTGALKTLTEGTRLGPYEIVSLIAAGGMGEVYKARDTRLDRTVAVKVLPADVAADAGLRTRFEREARTISSLSHPHICGLYDVGEQDGRSFLVMEYLEGDSLTDRHTKGPLPLHQALRHATEIAEALAEAHRHGVVHRDLKPGNVMLTEKGAKLLDFGIAKLRAGAVSEDAPAATATALTGEGLIVGTPQYMAPEQLEGKQVDARTDVFAFGVVLYEMVTGRKAFEAPSRAGLIAAILEREPPPLSQFQPLSPASLDALVKRCIAKRPADRFQSAQDLAFSLELVSTPSGIAAAGPAARLAGSPSRRRSTLAVLGVALGALAAGALGGRILWRPEPAASAPVHVSRLTELAGLEEFPALSPDGKSVAFTADVDGKRQVWVRLVAGGPALQLTREPTDHLHPRWSRDGSSLVYFSPPPEHEEAGSLWEVSALGGAPRRLARSLSGADSSRADDRLAFFRLGAGRTELVVAERDGSDLRVVAGLEPGYVYGTPRWSPDGRLLAYERHYTAAGEIFVIGTGETRPRQLIGGTGGIDFVNGLGWLPDGSGLAFSSSQGSTLLYLPTFQLWTLRLGDSRPRQLTFGEASYVHPDFDRSGALVASRVQMRSDLWRFPVDGDGVENVRRAARVMRQTAQVRTPSVSPDGREVVYVSDVPGHSNLWVTRLEDGQARQLTFERDRSLFVGVPLWSPDGRQIAFYWQGERSFGYSIIQPDGSGLRRILTAAWWACWSPDGRWLYYQDQPGAPARPLKKVPIEGGPPMLVRSENANKPALSPDGKTLYFVVEVPRATGAVDYEIRSASPEEGPSRLLARIAAHRMPGALHSHPVLSPDGRWLAMPLIDGVATNIWAIATADGAMRPLTGFGNRPTLIARRVSWSPDGRFVYAAVSEGDSDIVLLDGLVR